VTKLTVAFRNFAKSRGMRIIWPAVLAKKDKRLFDVILTVHRC